MQLCEQKKLFDPEFEKNWKYINKDDKKPQPKILIKQEDSISFLEDLKEGSLDLIITDPAYSGMNNKLMLGTGRIVGNYKDKGKVNGKWFKEFEDSENNYSRFLSACKKALNKDTGHIYIMFDSYSLLTLGRLMRKYFDVKNIITWDKVNLGMGHYFRRRHEFIIFATTGNNRKIRNRRFPDVWRFKRLHGAEYPTQKPVELFQTMIFASAEKGFNICDPFVGSGSSAIAALKNDCNFFGCDISKKAIDFTNQRIQDFIQTGIDIYQKKSSFIDSESVFWE